jgi:hypothetical protein
MAAGRVWHLRPATTALCQPRDGARPSAAVWRSPPMRRCPLSPSVGGGWGDDTVAGREPPSIEMRILRKSTERPASLPALARSWLTPAPSLPALETTDAGAVRVPPCTPAPPTFLHRWTTDRVPVARPA